MSRPKPVPGRDPIPGNAPVLVTGCAGNLGRAAVAGLRAGGRAVHGLDQVAHPDLETQWVGDLNDRDTLDRAVAGCHAVVHLAGQPDPGRPFDELLDANLRGFHTVLDAAAAVGVRRFVFASSAQTVAWCEGRPLTAADRGPMNPYAMMKLWAEELGAHLAKKYAMSFIAARIGWTPNSPGLAAYFHTSADARQLYLSHADAARFFARAVDPGAGPGPGESAVLYAVGPGDAGVQRFDLAPGRRLIGYEPRDAFPEGLADHLGEAE